MRAAVLTLLFANLAFFAWARWVDVPPHAPPSPTDKLPQLKLSSEAPISATVSPQPTGVTNQPERCLNAGPFADVGAAGKALVTLRDKGLEPTARAEESGTGWWVYVTVKDAAGAEAVLSSLKEQGIEDATPMPGESAKKVSVGLFSDRARAERRAGVVQKLGLRPELEQRPLPPTYWIQARLPHGLKNVPTDDLAQELKTAQVNVETCPESMKINAPGGPLPNAPTAVPPTKIAARPATVP